MNIKSMKGRTVDFNALLAKNETSIAIGNGNMNARGDVLGPGGVIVKKKESIAQEYHKNNVNAVRRVSLKATEPDFFAGPAEAMAAVNAYADQLKAEAEGKQAEPAKDVKKSKRLIDSDE